VALVAGDLRADEAEAVLEKLGERGPDRGLQLVAAAVDGELKQR
jgi:hypothetical protein